MRPIIAAFSIILLSLACGCMEKTSEEPGVLYVCVDGSVVAEPSSCVKDNLSVAPDALPALVDDVAEGVFPSCIQLGCGNDTRYVGNKRTLKYHFCDCRYGMSISPENRVCLRDSGEAESLGYKPCMVCDPY